MKVSGDEKVWRDEEETTQGENELQKKRDGKVVVVRGVSKDRQKRKHISPGV